MRVQKCSEVLSVFTVLRVVVSTGKKEGISSLSLTILFIARFFSSFRVQSGTGEVEEKVE